MPNSTVPEKTSGIEHPCLRCGACCAFFRASFYWAEADDVSPGGVPVGMTRKLNDFRRSMLGMDGGNPRCIALQGEIGKRVFCSIYDSRASVCRDFEPSWENNRPNERCDRARAAWGLEPLKPGDWEEWSQIVLFPAIFFRERSSCRASSCGGSTGHHGRSGTSTPA
jgi:Fe-S-cluster containining protein